MAILAVLMIITAIGNGAFMYYAFSSIVAGVAGVFIAGIAAVLGAEMVSTETTNRCKRCRRRREASVKDSEKGGSTK